jgi:cytoskeleton protein RodZ
VFEIGSSLREARSRQKLELSQVERDTRIRGRYLAALENDEFDVLPAPAYVKGFLRTYAEYLGLDGQRFVDEYTTRFAPVEEPAGAPPTPIGRGGLRGRRAFLVVSLGAVLGLVAWQLSAGDGRHRAAHAPPPPPTQAERTAVLPQPHAVKRRTVPARLELHAVHGPCWLSVRLGSQTGRQLFEGTLQQDGSARFVARRLWIRFGAPWNLEATLGGKPIRLPSATGDAVVTSAGVVGAA